MAKTKPVEIHKSHQNEKKSKRNFEALLDNLNMRMAFPWADNDYGIDGQVELVSPIKNSESFRPDSKFFLLQLKSTEVLKTLGNNITFTIPVKKIIQWFSANLPVMLVINDLKNKAFYSIWIDEVLITELDGFNPNWVNQESINIKIPLTNNFRYYTLGTIRDYVLNWRIPTKKFLLAGTYFELKDKCKINLDTYTEICKPFNFESISNSRELLSNQLEQAIYRIAITGPSRVGKSTLINALLRSKDISPTGMEQTTAVPIQILPSRANMITITFRNGLSTTKPLSLGVIKEYASQEMNEDNKKEVALVAIQLINRQLEQGVSLFDIPGLDDPDENIYNYTWNTVTKANAILYLIDGSVYENGGYIFRREYKTHIEDLGQSLDKIFLVITKVNALTGNKLELLKERIAKDLRKLNLYDKVSNKIHYISAEESLEIRTGKNEGHDSVKKLEDDIWEYLLKENKVGLVNLNFVGKEIINSSKDLESILNTRLLNNSKRKKLIDAISIVKNKIPQLSELYWTKEEEVKAGISRSLSLRKVNILNQLESYLKSFTINEDLPNKRQLQNYLAQGCHKTLEEMNKEYAHQANLMKQVIDNWIESNLKQVRETIQNNSQKKVVDFSGLNNFQPPAIDLSSSFGVGLITGIVGFIINPGAAIVFAFTGFLSNLLASRTERRAMRITQIMELGTINYNDQFKKINSAYLELVQEHSKLVIDYANKKINLFLNDIEGQIQLFNTPLSGEDEKLYTETFSKVKNLCSSINEVNEEIEAWYRSI